MQKLAIIITFIFTLFSVSEFAMSNTPSHHESSILTVSEYMADGCGNAESKSHQTPLDCHKCIGHCHSSHLVNLTDFGHLGLAALALNSKVTYLSCDNQYCSIGLDDQLRPPIAS